MQAEGVVHVIDDDDAVRDSLSFLFMSSQIAVKTYASAPDFLNALPAIRGGCVVTDVRMPGMSGLDLLKHLRAEKNPIPVIVITGHGDVPLAVEAMKYGAADFLEKPFDDVTLLSAVRSALSDQASNQEHRLMRVAVEERVARLSAREREVLKGLIAGKPNKIIAYDLGISPRTVEIYRANVMTKMEAASLSELIRMSLTAEISDKS
jgi:two-component system response regulator FixJ